MEINFSLGDNHLYLCRVGTDYNHCWYYKEPDAVIDLSWWSGGFLGRKKDSLYGFLSVIKVKNTYTMIKNEQMFVSYLFLQRAFVNQDNHENVLPIS